MRSIKVHGSLVSYVPPVNRKPGMSDLVFGSAYIRLWYGPTTETYQAIYKGEVVIVRIIED